MPDNSYRFSVKFDKGDHDIDTETYIQALSSLTTIVKEANYQLEASERISINVVAQDTGSFDVGLAIKTIRDLFSNGTVQYLASLVTIVGGLYSLKKIDKHMDRSKTEINGDDVTIKNVQGNVIFHTHKDTYNIYTTNQVVQDAISNNFKSLENDESITGFEINNDDDTVRVERQEFADLAKKIEIKVENQEVTEIPANLIIVKLVFEGEDRKWEFLYNGIKISATVQDEGFWSQINDGKSFSKGDELVADLRIIREFDPTVAAYFNREYQVINVREHHPRKYREQLSIEDIE